MGMPLEQATQVALRLAAHGGEFTSQNVAEVFPVQPAFPTRQPQVPPAPAAEAHGELEPPAVALRCSRAVAP